MAMTPKAIREMAEKLGIPMLPPDHPEYTSGPQVHFVSRVPPTAQRKRAGSTAPDESKLAAKPDDGEKN